MKNTLLNRNIPCMPSRRGTAFVAAAIALSAAGCDAGTSLEVPPDISRNGVPLTVTYSPGSIITTTVISDGTPCAGQPLLVAATATDPTNGSLPVALAIDGSPGSPQIVQLMAPAPARQIEIFARTRSGATERRVLNVAVADCPQTKQTLKLHSSQNPYHPGRVDFRAKFSGRRPRLFRWFFGDGTQQVSTEPFVSHDYAELVDHKNVYTHFTTLVQETSTGLASGRRIAVGSTVATSRQMGFAQAEVRTNVTKTGSGVVVELNLINHEPAPIVFDHYLKHYLPCNTRQGPHTVHVGARSVFGPDTVIVNPPGPPTAGFVTLPAARSLRTRISLPLEKIPAETCALGFNLVGSSGGKPAYASFYLPVRRNREHTRPVTDAATIATLEHLTKQNLVPDDNHVDGEQLQQLKQRGLVAVTKTGLRRAK